MSEGNFIPCLVDNYYKASSVTLIQNRMVMMSADDTITPCTAATSYAIGVCLDTTTYTDVKVAIGLLGEFNVEVYGTASRGKFAKLANTSSYYDCVCDATPANTERIVGLFLESGTTGDKVRVLLFPNAMPAS
jgi:hypothetical protein